LRQTLKPLLSNKPYKDEQWIYNEYITKNRSARELSKELGVSYKLIQIYVEKFGHTVRNETRILESGDSDVD